MHTHSLSQQPLQPLLPADFHPSQGSHERCPTRFLTLALQELFGNTLHGMAAAVWGLNLSFNTKDTCDSSIKGLINTLTDAGMQVNLHDPLYKPNQAREHYPDNRVQLMENRYATLTGSDLLVIWNPSACFADIDIGLLHLHMNNPVIIDMCNLLDRHTMRYNNIQYYNNAHNYNNAQH